MKSKKTESRLKKVLALLQGATVALAEAVTDDDSGNPLAGEWIAFSFKLTSGENLELIVTADDEGNGPGALLGLWDFARKHGI